MPVRIYFRGLILFHVPIKGPDKDKLVAELISAPQQERDKKLKSIAPGDATAQELARKDDHEPELQVATGASALPPVGRRPSKSSKRGAKSPGKPRPSNKPAEEKVLAPTPITDARTDITVPGYTGRVERAPSYWNHVPSVRRLAAMGGSNLRLTNPNDEYVRNTVVVTGGTVRVKDVVTWDAHFPWGTDVEDAPSAPSEIKFMGVDYRGHAANECVVEFPDATDGVLVNGKRYVPGTQRTQRAPQGTVEVTIENYEYQRAKPVPWGMDFQFMFQRLGYAPLDPKILEGEEMEKLRTAARNADFEELLEEDMATLLQGDGWWPFPYIVSNASLMRLGQPLTALQGRPVCTPGH